MTAALDGRILDVIETKLLTITTGNGYQSNIVSVDRPPVAPEEKTAAQLPAISVRELRKVPRWHLRGAEEFRLPAQLILTVEVDDSDTDGAAAMAEIKALAADVKKLIYANKRWNNGSANLAQRTWIVGDNLHEPEVVGDRMTAQITIEILARADVTDPTAVKAV